MLQSIYPNSVTPASAHAPVSTVLLDKNYMTSQEPRALFSLSILRLPHNHSRCRPDGPGSNPSRVPTFFFFFLVFLFSFISAAYMIDSFIFYFKIFYTSPVSQHNLDYTRDKTRGSGQMLLILTIS